SKFDSLPAGSVASGAVAAVSVAIGTTAAGSVAIGTVAAGSVAIRAVQIARLLCGVAVAVATGGGVVPEVMTVHVDG
ncbi:MAG: hypothetical protein ACK56F_28870, partial [bacterium]